MFLKVWNLNNFILTIYYIANLLWKQKDIK